MHSATLDIAAAILLLSSVGSMGLLIKRAPKSRFTSPTSVLSMSDILSSVLTAIIVLFHHLGSDKVDKVLDSKGRYELPRASDIHYAVNSTESLEGIAYEDCDLKSVFFQYAMFLVPFINAFSSLLNFSFNCYTDARDVDQRCCKLICARSDAERSVDPAEKKDVETSRSSVGKTLAGSKFFRQRYRGLALLSQWLLPALFTGAFHIGEHRPVDLATRPSEDLVCAVAANFPLESCAQDLEDKFSDPVGISSSVQNYVSSEDYLLWPNPNSSEVDDVLRKVLEVVQAALNDSANSSESEGYVNTTQLLDIASDAATNYGGTGGRLRSRLTQGRMNEYHVNAKSSDAYYLKSYSSSDVHLKENEKVVAKCTKRRCIVSVRFLKIYLFLLLVLIYFAPILLSSLLLVVSYYKCREASRKIKDAKAHGDKAVQSVEAAGDDESSKEGWFAAKAEETEQVEDSGPSTTSSSKVEESVCLLACETEKMQGFFRIFKLNVLLAVALWSPFFFQIISKVFFCTRVPDWLTEVSFLATMIFAVFRNAVNLNIVKMEADAESYKTRNSVHPNRKFSDKI